MVTLGIHRIAHNQPWATFDSQTEDKHQRTKADIKLNSDHLTSFHSNPTSIMATKKYTLYKAEGDARPPCAFFASPQGCKNGDNCKFSHVIPGKASAPSPAPAPTCTPVPMSSTHSVSSSDISSESEDEALPTPRMTPKTNTPKKKQTPVKAVSVEDPFAAPGVMPNGKPSKKAATDMNNATTPKSEGKKKKRKRDATKSDPFANPKNSMMALVAAPPATATVGHHQQQAAPAPEAQIPQTPTNTPKPKKKKVQKEEHQQQSMSPFRTLNLPIASFALPGIDSGSGVTPKAKPSTPSKPTKPKIPVPQSTPEGLKWQKAVLDTRANPKYATTYDFEKIKAAHEAQTCGSASDWIKARPFGAWCQNNPHAIAIDCEMCETKCPVTGAHDHKALCRLSVVNAVNPEDVLIDTLVKPDWPVVNYRSFVNGIKKDHLESVQFTLQHAQAFLMALCSEETVIVGHALHNDLVALKMEHHCNADSAFLFQVKDEEHATCSLKDLAFSVLKREMPDVHDSVNDARVAMFCLEEGYVKTNGETTPIPRTFVKKNRIGSDQLFVHRIPRGCTQEHIQNMLLAHTAIQVKEVPEIEFNSETGKTTVVFPSADHAKLAFRTIDSEEKPDKSGRMTKRVYLRSGGYVSVRQMVARKRKP